MKRIVFLISPLMAISVFGQNHMERKLNQLRENIISETIQLQQTEAQIKKFEDALKETRLPDNSPALNLGLSEDFRRIPKIPTVDSQDYLGSVMLNTIEETNCDSCKLLVNMLELDSLSGEFKKKSLFNILQVKQGVKNNNDTTIVIVTKHTEIYPRSGLYPEGCPTYEINIECYRTGMPVPDKAARILALQVAKIIIPEYIEFSTSIIPKGFILTIPPHLIKTLQINNDMRR